MTLPVFTETAYWDAELQQYADWNAHCPVDQGHVWRYFKYCLRSQNRFFFKNPLIPLILDRFSQNTVTLPTNSMLYRARIDYDREHENLCWQFKDFEELRQIMENPDNHLPLCQAIARSAKEDADKISSSPEFEKFVEQKKLGFEGFDASGSGSPPPDKVNSPGRCNPEHVSFLYAANDAHTAVAEVRPFIRDAISIATLEAQKDLRLVDFYFEYDEHGVISIDDHFFHYIRAEFSILNKGNKDDYLITQFLTLLAQDAGYDGIRFRSSLVKDGVNYVIFDSSNCVPTSSKMYLIPEVKYTLMPILTDE